MNLEQALAKISELEAVVKTLQTNSDRADELQSEVAALKSEKTRVTQKNQELLGKIHKFKAIDESGVELEELISTHQKLQRDELVDKGRVNDAIEAGSKDIKAQMQKIQEQLDASEKARKDEAEKNVRLKIETEAIAALSKAKAINPRQVLRLAVDALKISETTGAVVAVGDDGLREIALTDYVKSLRENADWQHQFAPDELGGSGAPPAGNTGTGKTNPWAKETWNLTQQGLMYRQDPATAARMAKEAGVELRLQK